jgi:hypothetical protein
MTGKARSIFDPLSAGLALAVVALFGAALLGGCAAKQETMGTPPPGGPPPQMGPPPGGPPQVSGGAPFPLLDMIADKVIQQSQQSTCEQLWEQKGQPKPAQEQEFIQMLRGDPQMRTAFINKVAGPIANKMFACGMIP